MTEFKIGDKVKIVDAEYSAYNVGDVGVVIDDPDDVAEGYQVCVLARGYDFDQVFQAYQLELFNE